jgi:putative ABC transport system permease protein
VYGQLLRYDLSIGFARSYSADSLERAVAEVEGVERVEAWGGYRAAVTRPGGLLGNAFGIGAIPPGSGMVAFPMEEGRWLTAADSNGLVVNRHLLAQDPTLEVGSEVSLVIEGTPSRWVVVGVFPSGPGAAAFATREAMARATGSHGMDRVVLTSASRTPEAQGELSRRLRDRLQAAGFDVGASQLMAENRRVLEDHLLLVAGFLLLMAQAMILVGGLGLASTMSLAVLERTREIGVLRAIGARHRSILGMIQAEGLVIALLSWMLAVPLSIPMTLILGKVFGRIMMPVRQTTLLPEPRGMLLWLGVVVGVSLIACAWPAWRATRVTTAAALAYE